MASSQKILFIQPHQNTWVILIHTRLQEWHNRIYRSIVTKARIKRAKGNLGTYIQIYGTALFLWMPPSSPPLVLHQGKLLGVVIIVHLQFSLMQNSVIQYGAV